MKKISREEVQHVAYLARLGLTEEELERLGEQISAILDNMEILNELDTTAIPPTAQVIPVDNVMRRDEAGPSLTREKVLSNAPQKEEVYFRVPPVFE
jgi:aspartyl-tRNA(Asn)/glutamyl-tRNA(Gln) amidotransferase subunit C